MNQPPAQLLVGRGEYKSSDRNNSSGTIHRIQQSQTDQRQTEQTEFIRFQSGFNRTLMVSGLGTQLCLVWPEKRSASHPPMCPQNANAVCRSRTAHQWIAEPMRFPAMGGTRAADARYGSSSGKDHKRRVTLNHTTFSASSVLFFDAQKLRILLRSPKVTPLPGHF